MLEKADRPSGYAARPVPASWTSNKESTTHEDFILFWAMPTLACSERV